MLEKALKGSIRYYGLLVFFAGLILIGTIFYIYQMIEGLTVTGMSRDVSWGLYIGQMTFFVGVAASAVMVVLPYYLHNYKVFGKITILGEFLAIPSVIMCMLFVVADLGQPTRMLNIILHPTPNSIFFWDLVVLGGYLGLNAVIGWNVLDAERKGMAPQKWVKPLIYISIPWAISIHTVTAFIYAGLPGRGFWLTAILAPRFLASAFSAGPALLIILCLLIRRFTKFDAGKEAIQTLSKIVAYGMTVSIFFVLLELFTVFYSQIPEHMHHFQYLFLGYEGKSNFVPMMWGFVVMSILSVALLLNPKTRKKEGILGFACILVFVSLWIEKGVSFVVGGFIPSTLGRVFEYTPTIPEIGITVGIWAIGALILTLFYKLAITVKEETA